jgi:hypothetical protein
MKIAHLLGAAGLAAMLFAGAASAQTTAPAAAAAPAAMAPAMDKKAKSKECSMEADKQGLHGKARKAFRSKCKSGKM